MTPKEFLFKMRKIRTYYDTENRHIEADKLMCEILSDLGYGDGIAIFKTMIKWYT